MVTVKMRNERPIDQGLAARINAALSDRMSVPMKHVPNVLVDVEYAFESEGFTILITGVPAHHSATTGRTTVHARVSKTLQPQLDEFVETARRQKARRKALRDVPISYKAPSPAFPIVA